MLKLDTWSYSEAISHAAGWQRLALLWGSREVDINYLVKSGKTSAFCQHQSELAAYEACVWYNRARKKLA